MCEETVFWDLNYCLHYTAIGTDQIKKKYGDHGVRIKKEDFSFLLL